MNSKHLSKTSFLLSALLLIIAKPSMAATMGEVEIIPIDQPVAGKTYSQLTGEWWDWSLSFPNGLSPIEEDGVVRSGTQKQATNLWFLAGTFGSIANRHITIPTNPEEKTLFFPLFNTLWWVPEDGDTETEVRALAKENIDLVDFTLEENELSFTLDLYSDGTEDINISESELLEFRASSPPGGQTVNFEEGTIVTDGFGFSPGPRFPAVADGYWLGLTPLPLGEHTLNIKTIVPENNFFYRFLIQ